MNTKSIKSSPPHSPIIPTATEKGWIVKRLRAGNALTLSLVADENSRVAGHLAFSPVQVVGASAGWLGLGPVSVRPEPQRQGIGSALIHAGLDPLRKLGSDGCVVLGEPELSERSGFQRDPRLRLKGLPPEFFLVFPFKVSP